MFGGLVYDAPSLFGVIFGFHSLKTYFFQIASNCLTVSPLPMELAIFFQPRWCISLGQLVLPTPPHHKTIQQISPRMTQSSRKHAKASCLALPSGYMDMNLNEIYASKCLHSIKLPTVIHFPDLTFEAV